MLFKPYLCQKILKRETTETRRVVRENERLIVSKQPYYPLPDEILMIDRNGYERLKWQADRCYAVQPGRGKKAIAYIRLIGLAKQRLQDITSEEIEAEGLPLASFGATSVPGQVARALQREAFVELWDSINPDHPFQNNPDVWVLGFELAYKC